MVRLGFHFAMVFVVARSEISIDEFWEYGVLIIYTRVINDFDKLQKPHHMQLMLAFHGINPESSSNTGNRQFGYILVPHDAR